MSIEEYEKELAESYNGFDKQEDGSYIINFCGRPHLILPFGSSRKFKTKEQALNEYKKGLKKMKTVKDVVATCPEGWPVEDEYDICLCSKATNRMYFSPSKYKDMKTCYVICTREEYEQELLKANISEGIDHAISQATELLGLPRCMITGVAPVNEQWYDYDKQEAISLPPVGVECEIIREHEPIEVSHIKFIDNDVVFYNLSSEGMQHVHSFAPLALVKFRPLDYDKNKERNEFIENAIKVFEPVACKQVYDLKGGIAAIYDAGARFK